MKTIHLLPISEPKHSAKDFRKAFEEKLLIAASLDYIPDSLETLKAIDYIDLKLLMKYGASANSLDSQSRLLLN